MTGSHDKPMIHVFHTRGGHYIFDTNTNMVLKTEKSVTDELQGLSKGNSQAQSVIEDMKAAGYLSAKKIQEIIHPDSEQLSFFLNGSMKILILQVTQKCNLRCEYCVYSGKFSNRSHGTAVMNFETAMKGIDFFIEHSRATNHIYIGFYGGEPLLEFEMVKQCVDYALQRSEGKEIKFNLTTNATLLTGEIIEFFENYDFDVVISLDGPREIHDKNRRFPNKAHGSFDIVMANLRSVKQKFPDFFTKIRYNVVVDPENDFSCFNSFFAGSDIIDRYMVTSWMLDDEFLKNDLREKYNAFYYDRDYELFKLFLAQLGRLDPGNVSILVRNYAGDIEKKMGKNRFPATCLPDRGHHSGPCMPGVFRLFMDVYGNFFPCERVNEMSEIMRIGNVNTGLDIERARRLLNIGKVDEQECRNCWAIRHCYLCAKAADAGDRLSKEKKGSKCDEVRSTTEEMLKDYCALREFGYTSGGIDLAIVKESR